MMSSSTLYHNPRCSKSRAALAILQERGIEPRIVAYLEQAPSIAELNTLIAQLGLSDARAMMRQGEAEYQALALDNPAQSQEALIAALAAHPRLIERPIFVHNERAVIARPPERVLELL
jgi:arsenate reductase